MGLRKRQAAEAIKAAKKEEFGARLRNVPSSPRKMRLVVAVSYTHLTLPTN